MVDILPASSDVQLAQIYDVEPPSDDNERRRRSTELTAMCDQIGTPISRSILQIEINGNIY